MFAAFAFSSRGTSLYLRFVPTEKAVKLRGVLAPCACLYLTAMASISQRTPFGKSFTATQLRAGFDVKYLA